jgi:ubiquinone/menaquinone biosynthesis C-methylase UbiE
MAVDLRVESIEETTFEDGFFDVVTCNASLSYWRHLSHCFNEIHRILKPGGGSDPV